MGIKSGVRTSFLAAALAAGWPAVQGVSGPLGEGQPGATRIDDDADSSGESRELTIINHSPRRIREVKFSSSKSRTYGDDLLGADEIDPGGKAVVTYKGPCRSDLDIEFEGGASEARRFLDTCAVREFDIAPGWTTRINPVSNL